MSGDHGGIPPSVTAHGVNASGSSSGLQVEIHTGMFGAGSPFHRKMWAVPAPVDVKLIRTFSVCGLDGSAFVTVTLRIVRLLPLGAGARPEIGTPSFADWKIVCGESAPSRFGCDTFGVVGVVERPAGGV